MAEAIATEGADHDDEETEDQDIAEIQIKGSIKTDEVKATHFFYLAARNHFVDDNLSPTCLKNYWQ